MFSFGLQNETCYICFLQKWLQTHLIPQVPTPDVLDLYPLTVPNHWKGDSDLSTDLHCSSKDIEQEQIEYTNDHLGCTAFASSKGCGDPISTAMQSVERPVRGTDATKVKNEINNLGCLNVHN